MAIPNNSTDLTSKCNDITGGNIQSTSVVSQQPKPTSDLLTEQRQHEQSETLKSERSQRSVKVYREFLITDLKSWTFKVQGENEQEHEHTARHCPVDTWARYFSEYADLDPAADWTDLEERADFLTQLWTFCAQESLSFPLTEKLNEVTTVL